MAFTLIPKKTLIKTKEVITDSNDEALLDFNEEQILVTVVKVKWCWLWWCW